MGKPEQLTDILKRLNTGEDADAVRAEAKEFLETIGPEDLAVAEQNLIDEGLSVHDMQGLCSIHLEVLGEQVEKMKAELPPDHIISTLVSEHEAILGFLDHLQQVNESIQQMSRYPGQTEEFRKLSHIAEHLVETERHHQREEDVLFPQLEKRGVYGPPTVMRQEHNELRPRKRELKEMAERVGEMDFEAFKGRLDELVRFIAPVLRDHIFKENNILYPTALQVIGSDADVWRQLKADCDEIGYCCFTPAA